MTKIVTEELKLKIKQYSEQGKTFVFIAKATGISESAARYWAISEPQREKLKNIAKARLSKYYEKRLLLKEKQCPKCRITKPISEFYKTQSYCMDCNRIYGRKYNKTFNRSYKLKAADKIRRKIKKKEVASLLGGKCYDCGLQLTDENLCVFDLHHKNLSDKEYREDWRSPTMTKKILEGKILLLCSNCHRMLHHKNGDSLYTTPKLKLNKV